MPPTTTTTTTTTPHLLTLPPELRNRIYTLALHANPLPFPNGIYHPPTVPVPNLSLLLTNKQVYSEARGIPLELYGVEREFVPATPILGFVQPFQIASLRRLAITYIYPTYLSTFTSYTNGYLFGLPDLNLDTLHIYADHWLTRSAASSWRNVAKPEDVHFDLPRSSRWLQAISKMEGWKQLDIEFRDGELETEYWEKGPFVQSLFDNFRAHISDLGEGFTIWHKQDDTPFNEKITVLRTTQLRSHGSPEWSMKDLGKLVQGKECVLAERRREREEQGPYDQGLEGGWRPDFHVGERLGTVKGRQGWCGWCDPRLIKG